MQNRGSENAVFRGGNILEEKYEDFGNSIVQCSLAVRYIFLVDDCKTSGCFLQSVWWARRNFWIFTGRLDSSLHFRHGYADTQWIIIPCKSAESVPEIYSCCLTWTICPTGRLTLFQPWMQRIWLPMFHQWLWWAYRLWLIQRKHSCCLKGRWCVSPYRQGCFLW